MTSLYNTRRAAREALASEKKGHDFYGGPPLPKARIEVSLSLRLPPAFVRREKSREEREADKKAIENGTATKANRMDYVIDTSARTAFEVRASDCAHVHTEARSFVV